EIEHALEDIAEAFSVGHRRASWVIAPLAQPLVIAGDHLVGHQALPVAVADLEQRRSLLEWHSRVMAGDRLGGLGGARERAGEDRIERLALQSAGQRLGLARAEFGQRRVLLALVAADPVPFTLAVANDNQSHSILTSGAGPASA